LLVYGVPDGATVEFGAPDPGDRVKRRPPEAHHGSTAIPHGERARRAGYVPDVIGPIDTLGRDGGVSVGLLCECTAVSLGAPPDDVVVVRVAGEVDLFTDPVLQAALADSLARGPCDLLVDLAAMTFCDVRGLAMLVQAGATAAERGIGYAVAAAPRQLRRVWPMLWPVVDLPVQYPSTAAGVLAALTRRHDDDLALGRSSADRGGADTGRHHNAGTCPGDR
jgi:anti-anti-sigma factor